MKNKKVFDIDINLLSIFNEFLQEKESCKSARDLTDKILFSLTRDTFKLEKIDYRIFKLIKYLILIFK